MRGTAVRRAGLLFVAAALVPLALGCSGGDGGSASGSSGSGGSGAGGSGEGGSGTGSGGSGGGAATCEERVKAATMHVNEALKANQACGIDEDCTTVFTSTDCSGACQEPVSKAGLANVEAAIAEANMQYCVNYVGDGCPYAEPGCAAGMITCMGGVCTLVF